MSDPFEQELRSRLRAMPEPHGTLDADEIVREARRRRRPKVIGVTVTAVAACALVLTPVTVVAIDVIRPTAMTATDAGGQEQEESAPEAPAEPAPPPEAPGESDEAAQPPSDADGACSAVPVEQMLPGVSITFEDDPADGTASVTVANDGDAALDEAVAGFGLAVVDDELEWAPTIGTDAQGEALALDPGESVTFDDVELVTDGQACTGSADAAGSLVPVMAIFGTHGLIPLTGTAWQG